MTVSSDLNKISYAGNGTTTVFAVNYYFLADAHLQVVLITADGTETVQTLTTNYTVSGAGNPAGGSVTMLVAPPTGTTVVIQREVPATQETDYLANDPFPAESHERALDKLTMLVQQNERENERALKIPLSAVPTSSTELPIPQGGKLLGWNSNASEITYIDPLDFVSVAAQQNSYGDVFTGNGSTSNYTLSRNPGSVFNIDVSINGSTQVPNVDYILSGTTLSFTTAPPNTSKILARYSEAFPLSTADAANVRYAPAGGVATTVEAKLRETVSVKDFGAVGDGVTDDTVAIQAAIDYVAGIGGGTVNLNGKFLVANNLTVKDYVSLVGPLQLPDELLPASGADYNQKNGSLIIGSSATVSLQDGASVSHLLVLRQGLSTPFSNATTAAAGVLAFSGTAFTVDGAGAYFHHLLILGFAQAIYSSGFERVRCEYVLGDCTNGIHLENVRDIAYVENCHFWPWLTVHQSWSFDVVAPSFPVAGSLLQRGGVAYKITNVGDWNKVTNCFAYGYATGFEVSYCNSVSLIGCGADNYSPIVGNTSIGFKILGGASTGVGIALVRCQAASQGTGLYINCTDFVASVSVASSNFFVNDDKHVYVVNGRAVLTNCGLRSSVATPSAIGVQADASSNGVTVENCIFASVPTPFNLVGSAVVKSVVADNRIVNNSEANIGQLRLFDLQPSNISTSVYSQSSNLGLIEKVTFNRGTLASPSDAATGDQVYRQDFYARAGGTTGQIGSARFIISASPSSTSYPGRYIIATTPIGSTTPSDRLVVNNDGKVYPGADNQQSLGDSSFRWLNSYAVNFRPGAGDIIWTSGTGSPEGVVTADVGSLFTRTDGGSGTTLYVKESGAGNTGWVAK